MTSARFIIGDAREVLSTVPDGSVDLILTSPPFLALRSYLPDDHPDKHLEIGSEATPADFLDVLLDLTEEWARVLAPHGSICVELGDTYSGSGSPGGDYNEGGIRAGQPRTSYSGARSRPRNDGGQYGNWPQGGTKHNHDTRPIKGAGSGWPLDKSLCGIPTLYTWSLAYGRNLLRPERTTDPWRIRNLVAWVRPNPPVGALGDKFRPATSYLTIATKSRTRWFDLDAVREPLTERASRELIEGRVTSGKTAKHDDGSVLSSGRGSGVQNPAGAPPLDWWEIPTAPYTGAHYATYPPELCVRPIKAMCPLRVCTVCGEPSRRIVEVDYEAHGERRDESKGVRGGAGASGEHAQHMAHGRATKKVETIGWTDCGCSTDGSHWRNGVVLDPFAGSGTTLAVATGHGRDAIGIDIDERNADLALERIGPLLLTVERHRRDGAA